jgi:hypothetical protein
MRPHNTRREFDRVWPWLDASLAAFGRTHTREQVWERIYHGHAMLWPGINAVALTEILRHPIGFKSCNLWLLGGELGEIKIMQPPIEQHARDHDCARMLISWGRDGWPRALPGYEKCGTRIAKWLADVPEYLRATKEG